VTALTLVSHALCPYVQRAAIALLEKGVRFERVTIDLADQPEWFRDLSPTGKVPLLRVGQNNGRESVLFESTVICEYLEETEGDVRLHPDDPLERARHRAWMEFGSAVLSDIWLLETTPDPSTFAATRDRLGKKFGRLELVLGDGPFFSAGQFSLVDAVFAPVFRYFDVFDTILPLGVFDELPKVRRWRAALSERQSVREAVGLDYGDRLRAFLAGQNSWLSRAGQAPETQVDDAIGRGVGSAGAAASLPVSAGYGTGSASSAQNASKGVPPERMAWSIPGSL
jgi:glutathione S-transferase